MVPVEIEGILAELATRETGIPSSAPPLPPDLIPPMYQFSRIGGSSSNLVSDSHNVRIHVYADTWEQAQILANRCVGWLKGVQFSDNPINSVGINALPYNNPDPNHPTIPRASFTAIVGCRSER